MAALAQPPQSNRQSLKIILAAAVVAISPDLDYVFYRLLNWGEGWHRGFSHSAAFALAAGAAAAIVVGPPTIRSFVIYSLATLSHPILDALVTDHVGGVPLFWPVSDHLFRFGLFDYTNILRGDPSRRDVLMRALRISLAELLVLGPILVASIWLRKRQDPIIGKEDALG